MNLRFVIFFLLSLVATMTIGRNASAQQNKGLDPRFALVIGNAKYPDSDAPLKNAINDAGELAKELRRDGFDVDIGENLSKNEMRGALDRLYGKIKSGSVVVIFFSGYGIQSNRQSYMIPVDAQIWTEADVRRDGFSLDTMLGEINKRGANVKVAILDASRRNPFERRFYPVSAGLAPVIAPRDTVIMYSAAPGTVIRDATADQGLFVTELIKEMRTPGLTGEEVFTHTRLNVTRASGGEQTPWFSSSLTEEFYFDQDTRRDSKLAVANTSVVHQSEPENRPALPTDPESRVRLDYQRAGQIGTRSAWENFLGNHPTGQYAILAQGQLAKLDTSRVSSKPSEPEPMKMAPAEKTTADGEAIRELDSQLQSSPSDIDAHYKRGALYAKNGDYSLAIKDFNEVIRVNPNDADALNNRCWARAILDELQTALKDCNEALRIRPRSANALDSRAFVKLKIGLPRDALIDYDASLQINANQASSLYGRGIAKMRSGNTAGGNSDVAAAKSINPRVVEEFANYGIQ
jgi:Flp pilus assembly protein TadD